MAIKVKRSPAQTFWLWAFPAISCLLLSDLSRLDLASIPGRAQAFSDCDSTDQLAYRSSEAMAKVVRIVYQMPDAL